MEISSLKDLIIKQMLDIQNTIFNVIPNLARLLNNHIMEGEQICKILFNANEQIKEIIQRCANNMNQINKISNQVQVSQTAQQNCFIHQNSAKKVQLRVTQEPNIGKPCCLCNADEGSAYGKIIIIPNSIRKLQAHQLCLNNIYNPRHVEFDKIYLLYRTYECISCKKAGASKICEKCNQKFHFPCFVDLCQEGILQCQCQQ